MGISSTCNQAPKSSPLPTSEYLRASRKIGTSDLISVIPGHWIDPGYEVGAPGERDFNMEVCLLKRGQYVHFLSSGFFYAANVGLCYDSIS